MSLRALLALLALVVAALVTLNVNNRFRRSDFLQECERESPADFCAKVWDGVK